MDHSNTSSEYLIGNDGMVELVTRADAPRHDISDYVISMYLTVVNSTLDGTIVQ